MSFSSKIKDELCRVVNNARHCNIAELTAILSLLGNIKISEKDEFKLSLSTEHAGLARKCFTILKKTFNIGTDITIRKNTFLTKNHNYTISVKNDFDTRNILTTSRLLHANGEIAEDLSLQDRFVLSNTCCKRAFLRGAFLAAGSMSDPEKGYHFEIVCTSLARAEQLKEILLSLETAAKIVGRKKSFVVYLKGSEEISRVLALMEAPVALLDLENIRILKGMRNEVNRKVNCEAANIHKTVSAAMKQIEDILYIQDEEGLDALSESLRDVAMLRLRYPEASLGELGTYLNPPVGKSGVNHRLRKISEIADRLKDERGNEKEL